MYSGRRAGEGFTPKSHPPTPVPSTLQDVASGPIWKDYISFLQAPRVGSETFEALFPNTAHGQEESARTVVIRCGSERVWTKVMRCEHLSLDHLSMGVTSFYLPLSLPHSITTFSGVLTRGQSWSPPTLLTPSIGTTRASRAHATRPWLER